MWTQLLPTDKDTCSRAIDRKLAPNFFNIHKLRLIGKLSNLKSRLTKIERKKPQDEIIIYIWIIFSIII
jgi:hypothetical protein